MIPYGRQEINQSDIDAVTEVLRSNWLTQGPVVPKFEDSVARYVGARHAVAVNSATSTCFISRFIDNPFTSRWGLRLDIAQNLSDFIKKLLVFQSFQHFRSKIIPMLSIL
jgi:hypothetical protein